jgi:hypothetical protein
MSDCEDFAGNVEVAVTNQSGGTHPTVNLSCLEDFGVEFSVVLLKFSKLQLQLVSVLLNDCPSSWSGRFEINRTTSCYSAIECSLTHDNF